MATPTTLPASFVSGAVLTAAQMNNLRGAFRVLQVVSTIKTDTFTATSTGAAGGTVIDITGLTATITPYETASKILVIAQINKGNYGNLVLKRGSTLIAQADAASNRVRATSAGFSIGGSEGAAPIFACHLDSPATTSATTYAASLITSQSVSVAYFINRGDTDTDAANFTRSTSSITLMEISA